MADEAAGNDTRGSSLGALLVLVLLVLAVAVGCWLVGWRASREEKFDWELASIFGTALGTTLLALATGWLAYSTRSEVRATQDLAELTRKDQAARERPLILVQNRHWQPFEDSPGGDLTVYFRNMGLGPALGIEIGARYTGDAEWEPDIGTGWFKASCRAMSTS